MISFGWSSSVDPGHPCGEPCSYDRDSSTYWVSSLSSNKVSKSRKLVKLNSPLAQCNQKFCIQESLSQMEEYVGIIAMAGLRNGSYQLIMSTLFQQKYFQQSVWPCDTEFILMKSYRAYTPDCHTDFWEKTYITWSSHPYQCLYGFKPRCVIIPYSIQINFEKLYR